MKWLIRSLDACFDNEAPRFNEENRVKLYRGMMTPYTYINDENKVVPIKEVGNRFTINNYISTTKEIKVAEGFACYPGEYEVVGYVYTIEPDYGVPFLEASWFTRHQYKYEQEVLLPRKMVAEVKSIESTNRMTLRIIASERFWHKTGCHEYNIGIIEPVNDLIKLSKKRKRIEGGKSRRTRRKRRKCKNKKTMKRYKK